jgi:hypothetical protein
MSLPILSQPTFTLNLPSDGREISYRPFLVAEEKILLVAQASNDTKDIISAFKQMITNCCLTPIDVDTLASFDIEYFFLQLRAKSVSNIVEVTMGEEEVVKKGVKVMRPKKVKIDLEQIQVHKSTVPNKMILDPLKGIGVVLKYPTFTILETLADIDQKNPDSIDKTFLSIIESMYDAENVYPMSEADPEEKKQFIDKLNPAQVEQLQSFIDDMPYVYIDIPDGTNEDGSDKTFRLRGFESFFE